MLRDAAVLPPLALALISAYAFAWTASRRVMLEVGNPPHRRRDDHRSRRRS